MKKLFCLISISTALVIAACNNSSTDNNTTAKDTTSFDLEKETAWVKENVVKFSEAYKRGDSTAAASYYGEDVLVMPPNSPAITRKNIAAMWGETMRMGVKDIKLNVDNVTGNKDILVETGTYEMLGNNNQLLEKGKYVTVLKKENGNWKIFRDIWNTNTPAASAK